MKLTSNPTAVRSQKAICEALFLLMQEKPFSRITVTELCEKAGVTRQAFYMNFVGKEDALTGILRQITRSLEQDLAAKDSSFYQSFLCFYRHWEQHQDFLSLLVQNNLVSILLRETEPYTALFPAVNRSFCRPAEKLEQSICALIAGALVRSLTNWAESAYSASCEELAEAAAALFRERVFLEPVC